jgi:hypothetical protein
MYVALRFLSLVLIAIGLALLGADLITTLEKGGDITIRSFDHVWNSISPASLGAFKAWLEEHLSAPFPKWVYSFMALPGWAVFGVPGVVLAFVFGGRKAGHA